MRSSPSTDPVPPDVAGALAAAGDRLGRLGGAFHFFSSTASTNDVAAQLAADGCSGIVVMADAQTAGRGRRGHTWFSPPGAGLYVSVVLTPGASVDAHRAIPLVTLAAGVALAEAVERSTKLAPEIKWPNDLYVGPRKLAGILAEAVGSIGAVVPGYGINVGSAAYPPELADRATSLETELGRAIDRAPLLVDTLAALAQRYDDLLAGRFDAILDAWRARAPRSRGARVAWTDASGSCHGITAGIDDQGALLVRTGDRVARIVGGEVVWSS